MGGAFGFELVIGQWIGLRDPRSFERSKRRNISKTESFTMINNHLIGTHPIRGYLVITIASLQFVFPEKG